MENRNPAPYFFVKNTARDGDWAFIAASDMTIDDPSLTLVRIATNMAEHPNVSFDRAWFSQAGAAALMQEDDLMSGPNLYYIIDTDTDKTLACIWKPRRVEDALEISTTRNAGQAQGRTILVDLLDPSNLMERALGLLGITSLVESNVEPSAAPLFDYRIALP